MSAGRLLPPDSEARLPNGFSYNSLGSANSSAKTTELYRLIRANCIGVRLMGFSNPQTHPFLEDRFDPAAKLLDGEKAHPRRVVSDRMGLKKMKRTATGVEYVDYRGEAEEALKASTPHLGVGHSYTWVNPTAPVHLAINNRSVGLISIVNEEKARSEEAPRAITTEWHLGNGNTHARLNVGTQAELEAREAAFIASTASTYDNFVSRLNAQPAAPKRCCGLKKGLTSNEVIVKGSPAADLGILIANAGRPTARFGFYDDTTMQRENAYQALQLYDFYAQKGCHLDFYEWDETAKTLEGQFKYVPIAEVENRAFTFHAKESKLAYCVKMGLAIAAGIALAVVWIADKNTHEEFVPTCEMYLLLASAVGLAFTYFAARHYYHKPTQRHAFNPDFNPQNMALRRGMLASKCLVALTSLVISAIEVVSLGTSQQRRQEHPIALTAFSVTLAVSAIFTAVKARSIWRSIQVSRSAKKVSQRISSTLSLPTYNAQVPRSDAPDREAKLVIV